MNHKTDMQAVLLDAMRVISESADEIKAGCAIDDEWPDAEDKAEYNRRVAVLERVRALVGKSAGVPEGWKIIRVNDHFDALIASLERAEGKGYLPDAIAKEWENFACAENVAVPAAPAPVSEPEQAFQARVKPWMLACFGAAIAADAVERNHRFFEEASELVQSCGMTASEAHQLVDYTWGRPVGEKSQEVGGVMVTLAALCLANGLDMHAAGEVELARISAPEMMAKIRAKQAAKPKHSPLPEARAAASAPTLREEPYASIIDHVRRGGVVKLLTHDEAVADADATAPTLGDDARECLMDVVSHHDNIVAGFAAQRLNACEAGDSDNATYWTREMNVAHRMQAQAERALAASAPTLEPVHGDVLPPVGERVFIHLARADVWEPHTVVGYYVWPDLRGDSFLQRVFVRVLHSDGTTNARMLRDIRRPDGSHYVEPTVKLPAPQPQAASAPTLSDGDAGKLPEEVREALIHSAGRWRGAACDTRDDAEGEHRSEDYNRRAQVIENWLSTASQPQAAEPKGLTEEHPRLWGQVLCALRKTGIEWKNEGWVFPSDDALHNFARAFLSKGE